MPFSRSACATLLVASIACSGETQSRPEGVVDAAPDVVADAGTTEAATGACDIGAPPASLPRVTSEFVIIGDAAAPPASTGGDETGTWVHKKITVYLPPEAAGQLDPTRSQVQGTGYSEWKAGEFRTFTDTETTLATSAFGNVVRGAATKAKGTYVVSGSDLVSTVSCRETTGEASQTDGKAGFSRLSPTTARVIITSKSALGTAIIATDMEKLP